MIAPYPLLRKVLPPHAEADCLIQAVRFYLKFAKCFINLTACCGLFFEIHGIEVVNTEWANHIAFDLFTHREVGG